MIANNDIVADSSKLPVPKGRILLADSHALFRTGMRFLLQELNWGSEPVEAATRKETLRLLETERFALALTSLFSAEGGSSCFLTELLASGEQSRVIILSGVDDPSLIRRAVSDGAAGFILKDTAPEITVQALRLVLAGGVYIPPAALGFDSPRGVPPGSLVPPPGVPELTERQREVLCRLAEGSSNKRLARELGLSSGAVKAHVASLLRIFGASNRTELVMIASRRGAIPSE